MNLDEEGIFLSRINITTRCDETATKLSVARLRQIWLIMWFISGEISANVIQSDYPDFGGTRIDSRLGKFAADPLSEKQERRWFCKLSISLFFVRHKMRLGL